MKMNNQNKASVVVHKADFGSAWPFTVDSGELCRDGDKVWLAHNGETYALNGLSQQITKHELWPIWRDDPDSPGRKINIGPMIEKGLSLTSK